MIQLSDDDFIGNSQLLEVRRRLPFGDLEASCYMGMAYLATQDPTGQFAQEDVLDLAHLIYNRLTEGRVIRTPADVSVSVYNQGRKLLLSDERLSLDGFILPVEEGNQRRYTSGPAIDSEENMFDLTDDSIDYLQEN